MIDPRLAAVILAAAMLGGGAGSRVDAVVDGLQGRYEGVRDLRARFVQRSHLAALDSEEISRGRLFYLRPGRLRWEIEEPDPHVLVVDDEAVRIFNAAEKTLQIAPLGPGSISQTALGFLFGETDLRRTFEVSALADPTDAGPDAAPDPETGATDPERVGLRLIPKEDAGFERLEAWIDPRTLRVDEVTIYDLLGNRTRLSLEQTEENVGLEEANFRIPVPEDTEVIDLR